jgi:hypothetical protein
MAVQELSATTGKWPRFRAHLAAVLTAAGRKSSEAALTHPHTTF